MAAPDFPRLFRHLLPVGRVFVRFVEKQLDQFLDALANVGAEVRDTADLAWLDYFPATTTYLAEWLDQFGLDNSPSLTDQEKRSRLDAAWKATGSPAPRYLQDTLQGLGFDVYVHEFWEPGTEPAVGVNACAVVRNPLLYLESGGTPSPSSSTIRCGGPDARCGNAEARCGNTLTAQGYPLVNKVVKTISDYEVRCGVPDVTCGDAEARCGASTGISEVPVEYIIPSDPDKWPFFVYIGAETFPNMATLTQERRDEFERTLLKYCPTHLWIGVMVNYV